MKHIKLIVYGIGALLLVIVAASVLDLVSYGLLKRQVFDHPDPLPEGLLCVSPEAGTISTSGTHCKYWDNETIHSYGYRLCVAIDRGLVGEAEISRSRLTLLIDGTANPVIYGNSKGGQVAIDLGQSIFYVSNITIGNPDLPPLQAPKTYCWLWADMPAGLYLADLSIDSLTHGVVKYRWAFEVRY